MSITKINATLPKCIIDELKVCEGVIFRDDSEMTVIEIIESAAGQSVFARFLTVDADEVDPLIIPAFGHPAFPYIPVATQVEVYNILRTFQPLTAGEIAAGGFPFIAAVFPVIAGFQYHHAKIAIQAVQEELQTIGIFGNQCPGISAIMSGQIVCDLTIAYANVAIATRIRKF